MQSNKEKSERERESKKEREVEQAYVLAYSLEL